ncbi:hypothetical protein XM38_024040 [Halomicronema hongdechloris C2206]|uniref:Uncharacterized protein n=1 Tax=Halomicronema hongdechloris C2206 TaxID=1641165 RepID=A0A1Z3HMA6_9CYAN|nr:hypothetical protein XM38_024040 [Halomicronema hongdechloris C2206]
MEWGVMEWGSGGVLNFELQHNCENSTLKTKTLKLHHP